MFRKFVGAWLLGFVIVVAAGVWLGVGCLGGDNELSVGAMCTSSDDCGENLYCVLGLCRSECLYDRDCPEGQVCFTLPSSPDELVCTFGDEGAGGVVDCPEGLTRPEPDGACRQVCDTDDCGGDRLCVDGYCWDSDDAPIVDAGDDGGDDAADVTTDGHDVDESVSDDAASDVDRDAATDVDGDADSDAVGDADGDVDGDADGDGVPHEACAADCLAFVIYPGGDMVACQYVGSAERGADQCDAEAFACNVEGGWHLCTASEYLARGGRDVSGIDAWLRSCIRDNPSPTAPTDDYCSNCQAPIPFGWVDIGWECETGVLHEQGGESELGDLGVRSSSACRRLGVNDAEYEAYWIDWGASFDNSRGGVCCVP